MTRFAVEHSTAPAKFTLCPLLPLCTIATSEETIWKIPVEGGTPVQLMDKSSFRPLFSPDGKFVSSAYHDEEVRPPRYRVAIIPAEGGPPAKVFDPPASADFTGGFWWTPDGRALTYVDTRDNVSNIWSLPLGGEKVVQLTNFKSKQIYCYALSHDGKQFVVSRGSGASDIVLIRDFK